MAILWRKEVKGILHEVRSAGATRRLYTDGVFHSQYNPRYPVAGHLWDLLMLPAFFVEPDRLGRVLVLGSGGGAVMRQLNDLLALDTIVGIDNNPLHHYVARKFFRVSGRPFELIEADATEWVTQYEGLPFDLVIDDLYGENNGEPVRAVKPNRQWFAGMSQLLTSSGILVMNFMSTRDFRSSSWWTNRLTRQRFPSCFRLNMDNYENIIGVFGRDKLSRQEFTQRLHQYPLLDQNRKTCKLRYRLRKESYV